MAMTQQDKKYWEERLSLKMLGYLWIATVITGAIIFPLLLFLLDVVNGQAKGWTWAMASSDITNGFMLGSAVSVLMYSIARIYLYMEWLPSRH